MFCLFASAQSPSTDTGSTPIKPYFASKRASTEPAERHYVLFVPPFGEEVNLCRRFHSLVRSQLTASGAICVIPDLYGTGDSAGLLGEASWAIWLDDLQRIIGHFFYAENTNQQVRHRLSIFATRAGCILASDLLLLMNQKKDFSNLDNIVFVHPEHSGELIVDRLFRARVLAKRFSGEAAESIKDLWALIERGENVHAGGQMLSPLLCLSMRQQVLDYSSLSSFGRNRICLELYPASSAAERTNEQKAGSVALPPGWKSKKMPSTPFWQAYEVEPDDSLVAIVAQAALQ